jgi:hypothetical protein
MGAKDLMNMAIPAAQRQTHPERGIALSSQFESRSLDELRNEKCAQSGLMDCGGPKRDTVDGSLPKYVDPMACKAVMSSRFLHSCKHLAVPMP